MLTNGPESKIGQIEVDIPRPRKRMVVEHPSYYSLRRDDLLPQSAETHQEIAGKKTAVIAGHGLEKSTSKLALCR